MDSVSSAEASLSCMEAGETEKESARGSFLFFRLLLFLLGYPAGASAEEREGRIRVKKEAIFPQIFSLLEGCYLIGNVILREVHLTTGKPLFYGLVLKYWTFSSKVV